MALDKKAGEKPIKSQNCWHRFCLSIQNCLINSGVYGGKLETNGPIASRHKLTVPLKSSSEFRICSYNINTVNQNQGSTSNSQILFPCHNVGINSNYRNKLVAKELIGYNAHIICLQDVDSNAYSQFYFPFFDENGFEGQFSNYELGYEYGLACFWKKENFERLEVETIVLEESLKAEKENKKVLKKINNNKKLSKYMFSHKTHMQVISLKSIKHPERAIVIGNAQLVDKFKSVRLLQTSAILQKLDKSVTKLYDAKQGFTVGVVCVGDFKCRPQSGIYELICEGSIPKFHPDWKDFISDDKLEMVLESPLEMDSAYGPSQKYTTYSNKSGDWSDYIFYDKDILEVTKIIPFPTEDEWKKYGQLPNTVLPSTHLACIADIRYKAGIMGSVNFLN